MKAGTQNDCVDFQLAAVIEFDTLPALEGTNPRQQSHFLFDDPAQKFEPFGERLRVVQCPRIPFDEKLQLEGLLLDCFFRLGKLAAEFFTRSAELDSGSRTMSRGRVPKHVPGFPVEQIAQQVLDFARGKQVDQEQDRQTQQRVDSLEARKAIRQPEIHVDVMQILAR